MLAQRARQDSASAADSRLSAQEVRLVYCFLALAVRQGGICVRVMCSEPSESELPFRSPAVPSVSASAPRTPSFQEP